MKNKLIGLIIIIVVCVSGLYLGLNYFYVVGEGIKAGHLNQVVYKGIVFKTYEGDVVQSGFNGRTSNSLQSYEFNFSMTNDSLAHELMLCTGKMVQLHYKEYRGTLPWRGVSKYVVDSIVSVDNQSIENSIQGL